MNIYQSIGIVLIGLLLGSCNNKRDYFADAKDIEEQHIEIVRFDNAIQNVHPERIAEDVNALYDEYPDFMPIFVEQILGLDVEDTTLLCESLKAFLGDTVYGFKKTNELEKELFSNIDDLQNELNQAVSKMLYLFPDIEIPTIYLMISGFNSTIYYDDETMAIGADMYLGSDYELYHNLVYEYQKITMRKECIPADIVSVLLFNNIPYTSQKNRLLEQMIYRGKILYLLSQLFENQKDWEVMGYSENQWKWCEKNEQAIWNTIISKRDLYRSESTILTSYLNDGPFTLEISQESPGRLGTWVGWRIVESYMEHNKTVSLKELMEEGDAQMILEQSQYRP